MLRQGADAMIIWTMYDNGGDNMNKQAKPSKQDKVGQKMRKSQRKERKRLDKWCSSVVLGELR